MSNYNGIILGTGHNALVLQAYLCRCGLRVLSVDRAAIAGGGLATIENPRLPGFWHNTHSYFHRAITASPWYRDLELERHGAEYLEPELNVAMFLPDGRALEWWLDLDRTVASFAEFSPRDAATLARWAKEFVPVVEEVLLPEAQSPPLPPDRRRALLDRFPSGRRFTEVSALSPIEFVQQEFENDIVRAGLLFFNGLREVDLRLHGFGHSIPALLAGRHKAQICRGGSARLAQALMADIQAHGGEVRCGIELRAILTQDDKAVGVELADGERLRSKFVASGLNPQQTFVHLLDAQTASSQRELAKRFQYNRIAPLFALNLALSEAPKYRAAEGHAERDRAGMVILGLDHLDQFSEIVAAHDANRIPNVRILWGSTPTRFDPSQAPDNHHTAFMWEKLPYALSGDASTWDDEQNAHGRRMLEAWREYAPNLSDEVVLDQFTRSPLDVERTLPNMQAGDLLVGSFANLQIGYNRPFPGAGCYRTSVSGLYLCGGSTHPGGNITGLCGYNAANVLASDLEIRPWWNPRSVEEMWSALDENR